MVAQLRNDELTIAQQELEAEEPAYETAITDLSGLAETIGLLQAAYDSGEPEQCSALFERIAQQVKCVATIHLNYNREVIDGYHEQIKADGWKSVLIPPGFKGCWHVA